ncbi:MAG: hypothetical protein KatS3mg024_1401 [Armatimonadota bacterium]|nr:MAG: hypothetical protein KatS3mg024_1401 [Armatimonadota bacterium]
MIRKGPYLAHRPPSREAPGLRDGSSSGYIVTRTDPTVPKGFAIP